LKQRKKGHRGIVTRLVNEATPLFEGERVEKSIIHLQTIDKQLTEKLKVLRGFNEEILTLIDVKDIENDVLESEDIAAKVSQLCGEIKAFLVKPDKLPPVSTVATTMKDPKTSERTHQGQTPWNIELNESYQNCTCLNFPRDNPFSILLGKLTSAVHQNADLSVIDKFNYLKGLVQYKDLHYLREIMQQP